MQNDKRSTGRKALFVSLEFISALVLVTLFFGVLLGVMALSFPVGTTLEELVRYERMLAEPAIEGEFDLALPEGETPLVALLSATYRRVQDRPAGALAWSPSHRGTRLKQRHAVQTYARSGATVAFGEHNRLDLGENALLIVRDLKERRRSGRINVSATIIEGEFHGHFDSQETSVGLHLQTERGTYEIDSSNDGSTEFRVRVNPDQSSTFSAYSGAAVFDTADRRVVIPANHAISVDVHGVASEPVPLPPRPRLTRPQHRESFAFGGRPASVRFGWKPVVDVDEYRFVLARDAELQNVVHDKSLSRTELRHANLSAGNYYWQVTARGAAADSPPSRVRSLTVSSDTLPPGIDVAFPSDPQPAGPFLLRGQADPGSTVFVHDVQVTLDDDGAFAVPLDLRPGVNLVVVEAIDAAGNAAYLSRVLNATARP